ncbi:MAG TPA: AAA family ATPase [Candidatus Absconditabacterales bacterium]|nr:AAA family ATPase [Candidatus Absconditabacterales bacterium]
MDQKTALNVLKSGKNVFLTGQAGSGKTFVLNQYIQHLRACGVKVAITASTGIAATHIGGTTIHSRSGIGIKEFLTDYDIEMMLQKEYLYKNIEPVSVLIIDEISMLSAQSLDMIDRVIQAIKNNNLAFGGLQVIFCGDFFQLPPVSKNGSSDTKRFAFAAKARKDLELSFCYLDTQHRQKDQDFSQILNQLRTGTPSEETIKKLQSRVNKASTKKSSVKLYTHNVDVDRINFDELMALEDEETIFDMQGSGEKKFLDSLKKSAIAQETLRLKIGAKVIFIKNNPVKGYRNGTTGIVVGFDKLDGFPRVQINDETTIKVEPEMRMIEDDEEILASIKQVPLKLARAITIHKSQGMTLDSAEIDLSKSFESGQSYVALSRIKSLDGLTLLGLNPAGLSAHPLVVRADNYFQQQSQVLQQFFSDLSDQEMLGRHEDFVSKNGGKFAPNASKTSTKKSIKSGKKSKANTLFQTAELVSQGKTLSEIITIRGIAQTTILDHLSKIKILYPHISLKKFKPASSQLTLIKKVIKSAEKNSKNFNEFGHLKLKPLYDLLGGKISYEEIKLALLFL